MLQIYFLQPDCTTADIISKFLFIGNLYPNFGYDQDQSCLPWLWFIDVYIILSIITPFAIFLMFRYPNVFVPIHATLFCIGSLIAQGV